MEMLRKCQHLQHHKCLIFVAAPIFGKAWVHFGQCWLAGVIAFVFVSVESLAVELSTEISHGTNY
jgi:hypothetical protein